jgi:hypothetical protein
MPTLLARLFLGLGLFLFWGAFESKNPKEKKKEKVLSFYAVTFKTFSSINNSPYYTTAYYY